MRTPARLMFAFATLGLVLPAATPASATALYTVSVFENGFNVGPCSGQQTINSSTPTGAALLCGPVGGNVTAGAGSSEGHVGTSLQLSESLGGQIFATATFSTDVVITPTAGSTATTIPIALNLAIAGSLAATDSANTAFNAVAEIAHTDFAYGTDIDAIGGVNLNPVERSMNFSSGGELATSTLDLVSGVLTTPFVTVGVGIPLHISFSLTIDGFANPGAIDDEFGSSLRSEERRVG